MQKIEITKLSSEISNLMLQEKSWVDIKPAITRLLELHKKTTPENKKYIENLLPQYLLYFEYREKAQEFSLYTDYILSFNISDDFNSHFFDEIIFSRDACFLESFIVKTFINHADILSDKSYNHIKFLIRFIRQDVLLSIKDFKPAAAGKNERRLEILSILKDEFKLRAPIDFANDEFSIGKTMKELWVFAQQVSMVKHDYNKKDNDSNQEDEGKVPPLINLSQSYQKLPEEKKAVFWDVYLEQIKKFTFSIGSINSLEFFLDAIPENYDYKINFLEKIITHTQKEKTNYYQDNYLYTALVLQQQIVTNASNKEYTTALLKMYKEYLNTLTFSEIYCINSIYYGKDKSLKPNENSTITLKYFDELYSDDDDGVFTPDQKNLDLIKGHIQTFQDYANESFKKAILTVNQSSSAHDIINALSYPKLIAGKKITLSDEQLMHFCESKFYKEASFFDISMAERLLNIVQKEERQLVKDRAATILFRLIYPKIRQTKNVPDSFKEKVYTAFKAAGYKSHLYDLKAEDQYENGCWYWAARNLVLNVKPNQTFKSFKVNDTEVKNNWIQTVPKNLDIPHMILNGSPESVCHFLYVGNYFVEQQIFDMSDKQVKITYNIPNDYKSRVLYFSEDHKASLYAKKAIQASDNNTKKKIVEILDKKGPFNFGGEYSLHRPAGHQIICCGYALNGNILFFTDSAPAGSTTFMSYNQFKRRAYLSDHQPFAMMGYHYTNQSKQGLKVIKDLEEIASPRPNSKGLIAYKYR